MFKAYLCVFMCLATTFSVDGGECDGTDLTACREADCQFDLVNKKCVGKITDCADGIFKDYAGCRRENGFYGNGGIICKNTVAAGCETQQKVYAINMNGKEYLLPTRNITFDSETPASFSDPLGLRKTTIWNREFCKDLKDVDFVNLYSVSVYGNMELKNKDGCVSHPIPINKGDGYYELAVWSLDGGHAKPHERCFNIMFNSEVVMSYVDITSLGGAHCARVELIVLFKVAKNGSQIIPLGFPNPIEITDGKLDLKFCMGGCNRIDFSFHVAAYSVVKLAEDCKSYKDDQTACKEGGCQYDLVSKKCTDKIKDCSAEMFQNYADCRRENGFYGKGGVICKNTNSTPCETAQKVHAINMNGKKYLLPTRNIEFDEETPESFNDPLNLRKTTIWNKEFCKDLKDKDFANLYSVSVYGNMELKNKDGCVSHPIPIKEDGYYELAVWSLDGGHAKPDERCFNIMFNDLVVMSYMDITSLGGAHCARVELLILFKVDGSKVHPQGFPKPIEITDGKLDLKFCMGGCNRIDFSFHVAAYSVVKLADMDNCDDDWLE